MFSLDCIYFCTSIFSWSIHISTFALLNSGTSGQYCLLNFRFIYTHSKFNISNTASRSILFHQIYFDCNFHWVKVQPRSVCIWSTYGWTCPGILSRKLKWTLRKWYSVDFIFKTRAWTRRWFNNDWCCMGISFCNVLCYLPRNAFIFSLEIFKGTTLISLFFIWSDGEKQNIYIRWKL